jgi:hypothetical protein
MWSGRTVWILVTLIAAMIFGSVLFWENAQLASIPSELTGEPPS